MILPLRRIDDHLPLNDDDLDDGGDDDDDNLDSFPSLLPWSQTLLLW